ncbi:hypothetical protein MSG28_014683 [Choristoneura fumiferana]|uniref:Uncharacterized protein n=1 Tax=Choristoneura fumiferana TaxID=7141 RepID=A0ACC0JSD2_CHOFU|nr:hypothetical protein MSG28_014683 [Choristoneura fumiferana]
MEVGEEDEKSNEIPNLDSMSPEEINQVILGSDLEWDDNDVDPQVPGRKRLRGESSPEEDETYLEGFTEVIRRKKRVNQRDSPLRDSAQRHSALPEEDDSNTFVEVSVSSKEGLPKKIGMARILKNSNVTGVLKVTYKSPYKILIRFKDCESAGTLMKCAQIINAGWTCRKTSEVAYTYGVVKDVDLDIDDDKIKDEFQCDLEIISAKRLNRRDKDGKWVRNAADETIPWIKISQDPTNKFSPKPYWSAEISESVAQRRLALKNFRKNPTPDNLSTLQTRISRSQQLIRRESAKAWRQFCSDIDTETSPSEMWRKMGWMKGKKSAGSAIDPAKATELLQSLTPDSVEELQPTLVDSFNPILEKKITMAELMNSLKRKDSAPGADNVSYSMIYNLPTSATGAVPDQWRHIKVVPVPKPGRDSDSASSLRPISLISCSCKIFHYILMKRIEWHVEHQSLLSDSTIGFRRARSCYDNLECTSTPGSVCLGLPSGLIYEAVYYIEQHHTAALAHYSPRARRRCDVHIQPHIKLYSRLQAESTIIIVIGNGQATSLEEQITVGGEKSSSGDHEPEDEALAGLPPGGLTTSHYSCQPSSWRKPSRPFTLPATSCSDPGDPRCSALKFATPEHSRRIMLNRGEFRLKHNSMNNLMKCTSCSKKTFQQNGRDNN